MISRRIFLRALAAGALTTPLSSFAQRRTVYRIGYLANDSDPRRESPTFKALMSALKELGWVEGTNIEMRTWSSGGSIERFPQLASEIVRDKVDVIVTGGSAATRAAQAATDTIPIVFASAADPVVDGFVATLSRPGANVTGLALAVQDLGPKRLQLLKEMLPRATRFVRLYQTATIGRIQPSIISEDDAAARRLGVGLEHLPVFDMNGVKAAFKSTRGRIDAIIVTGAGLFVATRREIAKLAIDERLPTMCADGRFAEAGALASYGEDFPSRYRRVALLVDKILRGAHPANMPVEQSSIFELVVNLKTAKAIGTAIPEQVLLQADRIIK